MELLTFATAGSVDDGKSSLIGRLLHDTGSLTRDQIDAVERTSRRHGHDRADLALVTDGLRAEREQGITIDVAYRYFATEHRKFVVADTPGHVQYTRNMVCGASVSDLAIVLVDARHGLTEQTRRHTYLLSLLGVPRLVLSVNKMDLVGYSRTRFDEVRRSMAELAGDIGAPEATAIPISALTGENVVGRAAPMSWYGGPTLLEHLERVPVAGIDDAGMTAARLPVQYVVRPRDDRHHDYRGYAGQMAGGTLQVGDAVVALPGGLHSTVAGVDGPLGPVDAATPPMSVSVRLADDIDVGGGDMICHVHDTPAVGHEVEGLLCWMDADQDMRPGRRLLLKQSSRTVVTEPVEISYRVDVRTLGAVPADSLRINDIGRVRLRTATPVICEDYVRNRVTGSFILIEPTTNRTVAAGIVARDRERRRDHVEAGARATSPTPGTSELDGGNE